MENDEEGEDQAEYEVEDDERKEVNGLEEDEVKE